MLKDLFFNATIIIAFTTLVNQFVLKNREINTYSSLLYKFTLGILTGGLGCILMLNSIRVSSTVIVDFRIIPIIIASIIGGFTSALVASLLIGVFRVLYFGINNASIFSLIVLIIIGVGCSIISVSIKSLRKKWIFSTLFSIILSSFVLIKFITYSDYLIQILLYYWTGTILATAITYLYLNHTLKNNEIFRRYKEESAKDFLTGLYNARQFDKTFNSLINKAIDKDEHLSLLFIDIDHFKRINDTYGHIEGDNILKQLGDILMKVCRSFDVVSRNGGEEFSILLLNCPPNQAFNIAERIRLIVANHKFLLSKGEAISITVSIGISTYPESTKDIRKLVEEADIALYKAKQQGRNRVVAYEKKNLSSISG